MTHDGYKCSICGAMISPEMAIFTQDETESGRYLCTIHYEKWMYKMIWFKNKLFYDYEKDDFTQSVLSMKNLLEYYDSFIEYMSKHGHLRSHKDFGKQAQDIRNILVQLFEDLNKVDKISEEN